MASTSELLDWDTLRWGLSAFCLAVAHPGPLSWAAPFLAVIGLLLFLQWELDRPRSGFSIWLWGSLVATGQLGWMASPQYVGIWCLFAVPMLASVIGLQWWITLRIWKRTRQPLLFATCWALMEWSRTFWFSGLLFGTWSTCLTDYPFLMMLANLGGHWTITWWLCAWAASWAKHGWRSPIMLALGALPILYGLLWRLSSLIGEQVRPTKQVSLIQTGHWPDRRHDDPSTCLEEIYDQLQRIPTSSDLIVLPESAVVFGLDTVLQEIPRITLRDFYSHLAVTRGSDLIIGADQSTSRGWTTGALWASPKGTTEYYAKQLLITGAEEVPGEWALPFLKPFGIQSSWQRGPSPALWRVSGWNIAPGICYEECHAGLCRTLHAQRADLLLFLNNDGWYDTSSLTYHHAAHGQLRAVELGCPVLQVGHTGITGGWDRHGVSLGSLPLYETGILSLEVRPATYTTPWSKWGYGTWSLFGIVTVLGWLSQRRAGRASLDPARRLEQIPSG
ncbi:MAG: apolipoprotein N-acyltransferase [Chlamydiia bacterium]